MRETITAPLQKSSYKMFMRTLKEQGQKSAGGALGWNWKVGPDRLYAARSWHSVLKWKSRRRVIFLRWKTMKLTYDTREKCQTQARG